ncbi:MAG: cytochrome P450 [Acidimicrobiia bacterium]
MTIPPDAGRIFREASAWGDPAAWHEIATQVRREQPVLRVEQEGGTPFWALTRYDDVMTVERNPALFTNEPGSTLTLVRPEPGHEVALKTLINMDGEEHRVHRLLVNDWFKPQSIRNLEDAVNARAKQSVDELAALGGECDFARDIALHYPLRVILTVLGLPESDFPRMLALTQELFGSEDPEFQRPQAEQEARQMEVIMDFIEYFQGVVADRRANPTDDLASVVANATMDGEPLSDSSIFGYLLIVATAGHDTTSNAVAGGMASLLKHPDQLERLRANPELVGTAAEEIVRWVTPVKHFMRTAQDDTEVGGQAIAKDDWVYMSFASANRDESVFPDPFRFDIGRTDAQSLGFGFGRHYCLGVHLAKMEIRAFFTELMSRLDSAELTGPVEYMQSALVTGPKHMPMKYSLRA